jgi:hypothetical protein
MSDFLTRLAARSLHRTQTISPRLASLFEPGQAAATSWQSAVTERSEAATGVSGSVVSTAVREAATSEAAIFPPAVPARRVGEAEGVLYAQAASPVVPTGPISAAERGLEDRWVGIKGLPLDPLRANELTGQRPDVNDRSFSRTGHSLATQDDQTSQVPPLPVAARVAASPAASMPVLEERHLLIAPKPSAGLELGNFAVMARVDREAAKPSQRTESSFAAEPSVQVTIGRIEVRAEKEPARSARATPAARAKPLEDYLRERSRRGSQ